MCRYLGLLLIGLSFLLPVCRCLAHPTGLSAGPTDDVHSYVKPPPPLVENPDAPKFPGLLKRRSPVRDGPTSTSARRRRLNREWRETRLDDTADSSLRPKLLEVAAASAYQELHDKRGMSEAAFLDLVRRVKALAPKRPTKADLADLVVGAGQLAEMNARSRHKRFADATHLAAHAVRTYHLARFNAEDISGRTGRPIAPVSHPRRSVTSPKILRRRGLDPPPVIKVTPAHVWERSSTRPGNGLARTLKSHRHRDILVPVVRHEGPLDDSASSTERSDHLSVAAHAAWARLDSHGAKVPCSKFRKMVRDALDELRRNPGRASGQEQLQQKRRAALARGVLPKNDPAYAAAEVAAAYVVERQLVEKWAHPKTVAGGSRTRVLHMANGKTLSGGLSEDEQPVARTPTARPM